ncbi:NYN domain-containing protein [Thermodesulfobacteriota bacterium]
MPINTENQVAVFIDYENIEVSYRQIIGKEAEVDWSTVLGSAVELGRVVIRRAYADWSTNSSSQRELLGLGIELINVSSKKRGKNVADIKIVIDALEMLTGPHFNFSHVLLVSGDGDFTDLVHYLRARGKIVVGMGVSGTSAEYLINACDKFIFYDLLNETSSEAKSEADAEGSKNVAFDLSEARLLLRKALNMHEGEWILAAILKQAMQRLNPAFDERNYNYERFKDFLKAQSDIAQIRKNKGGHPEVSGLSVEDVPPSDNDPEALLDLYLRYLVLNKIRMTPNVHRPSIITQFYSIINNGPDRSLEEVKEELHAYFEENAPNIKRQYVHEAVHQMFRTSCFVFDSTDKNYSPDTTLWRRKVCLTSDIKDAKDLLEKCDRNMIKMIGQNLNPVDDIDRKVITRLLYGSAEQQKMLEYVTQLIEKLKQSKVLK